MPRTRAVDPFGTRRVPRPSPTGPTPDPNADLLAPGELARRVAAAMNKRGAMTPGEVIVAVVDEATDAGQLPATFAQEAPGDVPGPDGAETVPEAQEAPQGQGGGDLAGWPDAKAAAEVLGVDPAEVRRRCREGLLAARKDLTGAWRIDPAALESPAGQ